MNPLSFDMLSPVQTFTPNILKNEYYVLLGALIIIQLWRKLRMTQGSQFPMLPSCQQLMNSISQKQLSCDKPKPIKGSQITGKLLSKVNVLRPSSHFMKKRVVLPNFLFGVDLSRCAPNLDKLASCHKGSFNLHGNPTVQYSQIKRKSLLQEGNTQ